MKYRKITKRGFIKRYLQTYSVNATGDAKLSKTEINVLTAILFHNTGKIADDYSSPFNGEGRKEILETLNGLAETTYSSTLKKLSKKNFLVPLGKKGEYAIPNYLVSLMTEVHTKDVMRISYGFQIIDDPKPVIDEDKQEDIKKGVTGDRN